MTICCFAPTVAIFLLAVYLTVLFLLPARDALHSAVFAVVQCLSVCLLHAGAGIVSKRLNLS